MTAWTWESSAPGAEGCGVSDGEDGAMAGAAAWMREHAAVSARVEPVCLDAVELAYVPAGRGVEAVRDGDSVTWRPAPM
jgi:hypothetical protein